MRKRLLALFMTLFMILPMPVEAKSKITIIANEKVVEFQGQEPVIKDGRTLVPIRNVFESLGFSVDWDGETSTATLSDTNNTVSIAIGASTFTVNENTIEPDVPAQIINGSSMLPLRAVSEALGSEVLWNGDTFTAKIIYSGDISPVKEEVKKSIYSGKNIKIHAIDVGQGDSTLINLPNGQNVLIDGGTRGASGGIIKYLRKENVGHIDYLVATHPHEDHIGGLADIMDTFSIGTVYMPDIVHTTKTFERFIDTIIKHNIPVKTLAVGDSLYRDEELVLDVISPTQVLLNERDLNNASICLTVRFKDNQFLFMADAEKEAEHMMVESYDINSDLLRVGHHGSKTSTTEEFLSNVNPRYAIISCGENNSYGHPHKEVMDRLESRNIKTYRTDINGHIIITSNGQDIEINSYKEGKSINVQPEKLLKETLPTKKEEEKPQEPVGKTVYITRTGTKYHRENCRYLKGGKQKVNLSDILSTHEPCKVCKP